MCRKSSLITRRCGSLSKDASKERIGREPLRQLPVKWSSSIVWTVQFPLAWDGNGNWEGSSTVLHMHLHGRSIRCFAHPQVKILSFSRLEEEYIVAIVQLREFVQLVEFGFRVEFCIFAAVREEGCDIIQEMSMSVPIPNQYLILEFVAGGGELTCRLFLAKRGSGLFAYFS